MVYSYFLARLQNNSSLWIDVVCLSVRPSVSLSDINILVNLCVQVVEFALQSCHIPSSVVSCLTDGYSEDSRGFLLKFRDCL